MEYRSLGGSELTVSALCLGTMTFGAGTDARCAGRILGAARAAGVNFVDTADVNADGESERILGALIARRRDSWVVMTKPGSIDGRPGANPGGYTGKRLRELLEASLRRLATSHVDVYVLDWDDMLTPLEETVSALHGLIVAGKARYWGFSNYRAWRAAELVRVAEGVGAPRPLIGQPCYHAMYRAPEADYLPACEHFGVAVVTYSPLARGLLTGKYRPDAPPPSDSRAGRQDRRMMETEFRRESLVVAQAIAARARARAMTPGQFALLWVLNNRLVTSVIGGPRTVGQWQEYLGALEHRFTPEDEAYVERLVPPGQSSTPGYADPGQPVAGRVSRVSE